MAGSSTTPAQGAYPRAHRPLAVDDAERNLLRTVRIRDRLGVRQARCRASAAMPPCLVVLCWVPLHERSGTGGTGSLDADAEPRLRRGGLRRVRGGYEMGHAIAERCPLPHGPHPSVSW